MTGMRRTLVLLPLAVSGLSLAMAASADPPAKPTPASAAPGATAASAPATKNKTPVKKHRTYKAQTNKPHPTIATAMRRADYDVVEGLLGQAMPGAVCPSEMANIDDRFCIDRWEGSLVEVLADGREVPWPPFGALEPGRHLRAVSVANVYPQAYISGEQAAQACAAAGKRLCAPVEWRKACMGPDPSTFGYGAARRSGKCNDGGTSPMLRLYPQVAQSWRTVGM